MRTHTVSDQTDIMDGEIFLRNHPINEISQKVPHHFCFPSRDGVFTQSPILPIHHTNIRIKVPEMLLDQHFNPRSLVAVQPAVYEEGYGNCRIQFSWYFGIIHKNLYEFRLISGIEWNRLMSCNVYPTESETFEMHFYLCKSSLRFSTPKCNILFDRVILQS